MRRRAASAGSRGWPRSPRPKAALGWPATAPPRAGGWCSGRAGTGTGRAGAGGNAGAEGDVFVAMAGIGLDAAVVGGAGRRSKRRLGWVAYALAGMGRLALPARDFTVRLDGGEVLARRARCVV